MLWRSREVIPSVRIWTKRCIEYWALQGRKYGAVIDLDRVTVDFSPGGLVRSSARVVAVVPGKRVDEHEWRRLNSPA